MFQCCLWPLQLWLMFTPHLSSGLVPWHPLPVTAPGHSFCTFSSDPGSSSPLSSWTFLQYIPISWSPRNSWLPSLLHTSILEEVGSVRPPCMARETSFTSGLFKVWSPSPGNLLEMHHLRPHLGATESQALGLGPAQRGSIHIGTSPPGDSDA